MMAKKIVSTLTLAMVVATAGVSASTSAMAGGYGYGSSNSWRQQQTYAPKRQNVRRQVYNGSNQHLRWCYNRFKSYRRSDNTFQPYHGARRECLSPYVQDRLALFADHHQQAPEVLFQNQVESGFTQDGRDSFGNLPEGGQTGAVSSGGNGGQADSFGNLPEQSAAVSNEAAPAVQGQPVVAPQVPALQVPAVQAPAAQVPAATQAPAPVQAPAAAAPVSAAPAGNGVQSEAAPAVAPAVEAAPVADVAPAAEAAGQTATE